MGRCHYVKQTQGGARVSSIILESALHVAVSEEDEPGSAGGPLRAAGPLRTDENTNSSAMRPLLGDYVVMSDTGPNRTMVHWPISSAPVLQTGRTRLFSMCG